MKIINSKFEHNLCFTDYSLNENSCFLDIETLGLNRNKHMIYLVGILYFDKKTNLWSLDQYFSDTIMGEKSMLIELVKKVINFHTIITYNGNAFDLPYLNHRLSMYNIDFNFSTVNSLDLYAIIRKNKHYLNLNNYKLKTLERYIGIYREDIYSGRDCIDFYNQYLTNQESSLKNRILQHNYDDLFYMLDLFQILDILKDKKTISIVINKENLELVIDQIKIEGDFLIAQGDIFSINDYNINHYEDNHKFIIHEESFLINIEFKKGLITPTKTCYFIYNKDFLVNILDKSQHSAPNGVILLQVENHLIIPNIKNLIENLVKNILIY